MTYELLILILFTCLHFDFSHETIQYSQPIQFNEITGHTYQFMFIGQKPLANVTGRLVAADPIYACNWEDITNKEDFEGNIVLVRRDHCSPVDKFKTAQKGSAIAIVVLVSKNEFLHLSASYFLHAEGITIPGFEYRPDLQSTYDELLKFTAQNVTFHVSIEGELAETDPKFWLAFSIVIGTFSFINTFVAYKKIKQLYKAQNVNRTLPQITLAIEMLTNVLRVILCLEPDYGLGRGLIEFGTVGFLQSGTLPWSLIPTLIITFYWDDAIKNWEVYIKKSISILPTKTCKLPLIIISPLIVMADLMSGVIRAMYYGNKTMEDIILLSSAAVVLFVAILFTANSVRALHFMWKKSQSTNQQHKLAVRRTTNFVFINCCGIYVIVVFLLFISAGYPKDIWKIGYFIILMALNVMSLSQILVFDPQTIFQLAELEKEVEEMQPRKSLNIPIAQSLHDMITDSNDNFNTTNNADPSNNAINV